MGLITDTTTDGPLHAAHAPRRVAQRRPLLSERVLVPAVAALTAGLLAEEAFEAVVLTTLAFACAAFVVPERRAWANLLPLMRDPLVVLAPLLGICALTLVNAVTGLPGLSTVEMILVATAAASASVACSLSGARTRQGPLRTAIIGSQRNATDVARELALVGIPGYQVVGRIAIAAGPSRVDGEVPTLGALGGLADVIEANDIDLLVLTSEAPRFGVFEEMSTTASTCRCASRSCPRSTRRSSVTCRWPRSTRPGSSTSCTRSSGPSRRHRSARWTSSSRRSPLVATAPLMAPERARDQAGWRPRLLQADPHRRGRPHAHAVQAAHDEGRRPERAVGRAPTTRA